VFDESASSTCSGLPAARALHVVVEPRRGVEEERRLAHRLPDRHAGHAATARAASIYVNKRFSDHAPLVIDYDYAPIRLTDSRSRAARTACSKARR
jgi:hypothetical protein